MRCNDDKYIVLTYHNDCPNHSTWIYPTETLDEAMKIVYKIISGKKEAATQISQYHDYPHMHLDHIEVGKLINNFNFKNQIIAVVYSEED